MKTTSHKMPSPRAANAGLTLTELMIAMVISLLVMLTLFSLFMNVSRGNRELVKVHNVIENGRFALQLLQQDLAHAGFWDIHVPEFDDLTDPTASDALVANAPTGVPAPCQAFASWNAPYINNLLALPVQAYDAAPSGCAVVSNKVADTDVLLVRHAETCVAGTGNCENDDAGKLYFQTSRCSADPAPYVLATGGHTLRKHGCGTDPADIVGKRKFVSNMYYIRNYADDPGDGIPTLVRSHFDLAGGTLAHQPAQALIEGIQAFRVELGVDRFSANGTDIFEAHPTVPGALRYQTGIDWADPATRNLPRNRGDGAADTFIRCTSAAPCDQHQLANTVAVRLHVLVRSRETSPGYTDDKTYTLGDLTLGPFNDQFKRHVFSTTVRFNSKSGRRYAQ